MRAAAIVVGLILAIGFGRSANAQSAGAETASHDVPSAPSTVSVSQSSHGWAYRYVYSDALGSRAAVLGAAGLKLFMAEEDLPATDHGKTIALATVVVVRSAAPHDAPLASQPYRLIPVRPLGFALAGLSDAITAIGETARQKATA